MPGIPLNQYRAAVSAAMQPPTEAQTAGAIPYTTAPPEAMFDAPQAPAPQTSPYLPANAFGPAANPIEQGVALAQQRGDLPADPAPAAAPQAGPVAQAPQHPFPLEAAGGPSLRNAQGNVNAATEGAIEQVTQGGGQMAGREYALALEMERGARERQAAAEQAMAEQEEEMLQKQHDFAQSAKALGQFAFKPDGGFHASQTTGQKIAGVFHLALNGFMAGVGRPVPDLVLRGVEQSIRAQENAYNALKDTAHAQQNAFTQAMQKFGNANAARHMVRAAALEGLQAEAAQVMALNKGTEAGNRAAMAYADLEQQKMQQIAQGIRWLPQQATGRRFVDQNTGLVYTEQEAKQLAGKWYEQAAAREMKGLDVAGNLMVEGEKAGLKRATDARQHEVRLPNGEIVQAPNDKEADNLRGLSESLAKTQRMVEEAKEIRAGWSFRAPMTKERERLKQIQADLVSEYSVQHKFGALSEGDRKHAEEGTADLFGTGGAVEARLDRLNATALTNLQSRVKTIPGASSGAQGTIPKDAGLKFHGGK
jgi:hypothetical protein